MSMFSTIATSITVKKPLIKNWHLVSHRWATHTVSYRRYGVSRDFKTCWVSMVVFTCMFFANANELRIAPINPDFKAFVEASTNSKQASLAQGDGSFGWVPAPVSVTALMDDSRTIDPVTLETAPASYDLRSLGRLTSIKDQNPWGTCWTFGTYASMESCLLPGETRDFSEKNLANLHGFDLGYNDGGQGMMSMAYLCRWGGPINESDDSYPSGSWSSSPSGLTVRKHVQQVQIIPGKASATDNAAIKQAIMDHGAMLVSYYHDNSYYNSTYSSYYFTGSSSVNHGVAIVGWDDNFDRTKFGTTAPANGAYIVKNSWGTGWADSGYFYVSYYDTAFAYGDMFVFLSAESTDNYSNIYQYDPLGWVSSLSTPWAAAIYTATASEAIRAVGFYTDAGTTSYSLYVYTGVSAGAPRSGTLACSMSGSITYPGYHTISLTTPAAVTSGQRFSVVLCLNGTSAYPQAIEYAVSSYSSGATAGSGQTYYSFDGGSFTDLTSWNSTANFCLKAYGLADSTPPAAPTISSSTHPNESAWYSSDDPAFTWTTPTDASGIAGYSYVFNSSSSTIPDTTVDTTGNSRSYTSVVNGTSYFHVRAKDNSGNWGSADHYRVQIDDESPSVTINQAVSQADPTGGTSVNFTVVFSESVADFTTGDVTIDGTAPGTKTGTVTGSGTTYNVAVSGMSGSGTVIATIAANKAHDIAGNGNMNSTSTDNTVTFEFTEPDSDNDGIPDWWETLYYGGKTNANALAICSNGINTIRQAYVAGFNPTDPDAQFIIASFGDGLHWNCVSGRVYSVYWTTNLLNGFVPLETNIPWTVNQFIDTLHGDEGSGFYKLGVDLQ